jgi:MinD superfamily P-loop ATPase
MADEEGTRMKTVSVISSKGGVGKTMISVSLIDYVARRGKRVVVVDADVNAPNLAKWFDNITEWDTEEDIKIFPLPRKYEKCKDIKILCDGKVLPVEYEKRGSAFLARGYTPSFADYQIDFVYGDIYQGQTGSGKVVEGTLKLSENGDYDLRIIDTAPGTGYPVLTAINHSDYIIAVTEPTQLGFHDLIKLIGVIGDKNYGVFVNKAGYNDEILNQIKVYSGDQYLGSLDYDVNILASLEKHVPPLLHYKNSDLESFLELVLKRIMPAADILE